MRYSVLGQNNFAAVICFGEGSIKNFACVVLRYFARLVFFGVLADYLLPVSRSFSRATSDRARPGLLRSVSYSVRGRGNFAAVICFGDGSTQNFACVLTGRKRTGLSRPAGVGRGRSARSACRGFAVRRTVRLQRFPAEVKTGRTFAKNSYGGVEAT